MKKKAKKKKITNFKELNIIYYFKEIKDIFEIK